MKKRPKNTDIEYIFREFEQKKISNANFLKILADTIDNSLDQKCLDTLNIIIEKENEINSFKHISLKEQAYLFYFLSNVFAGKREILFSNHFPWRSYELQKQIFYLKKALLFEESQNIDLETKSKILTNLGNSFSEVGRCIESLDYYNRVLEKNPNFPMAQGNKGLALFYYANNLYDQGHAKIFLKEAYSHLITSVEKKEDSFAKNQFYEKIDIIKKICPIFPHNFLDKIFSLGDTKEEQEYRLWVLKEKLFLNPLNDLGSFSIAARDILTIPSIIRKIGEPPKYHGFYNQLVQEFISVRFLFYEGIHENSHHFSDNDVLLFDTLDYPIYSYNIEKIKISYRIVYSLLDKIAFFINDYYELGNKKNSVNFRTIWYDNKGAKKNEPIIKETLLNRKNMSLIGLFWLSKDLYDSNSDNKDVIEPEAKELNLIRNHLEHKYFQLHTMCDKNSKFIGNLTFDNNDLVYPMSIDDFVRKTFKLFNLARAALMYLSFSLKCEEKNKEHIREKSIIVSSSLPLYKKENLN